MLRSALAPSVFRSFFDLDTVSVVADLFSEANFYETEISLGPQFVADGPYGMNALYMSYFARIGYAIATPVQFGSPFTVAFWLKWDANANNMMTNSGSTEWGTASDTYAEIMTLGLPTNIYDGYYIEPPQNAFRIMGLNRNDPMQTIYKLAISVPFNATSSSLYLTNFVLPGGPNDGVKQICPGEGVGCYLVTTLVYYTHYAVTMDATGYMSVYVNGTSVLATQTPGVSTLSRDLLITPGSAGWYAGVQVSNSTALAACDVMSIYANQGCPYASGGSCASPPPPSPSPPPMPPPSPPKPPSPPAPPPSATVCELTTSAYDFTPAYVSTSPTVMDFGNGPYRVNVSRFPVYDRVGKLNLTLYEDPYAESAPQIVADAPYGMSALYFSAGCFGFNNNCPFTVLTAARAVPRARLHLSLHC
jgi:hypothetical protein